MVDLYEWIKGVTPADFPQVPFKLADWLTVLDTQTVLDCLRQDIALNTYRVRTGAVNSDLRMLYERKIYIEKVQS